MKNAILYKKLRLSLGEWAYMGERNNRIASSQIGVISGGINLSDDWAEQETIRELCVSLTQKIIENNGRLTTLLEIHDSAFNKHGGLEIIRDEMQSREYDKESL